MTAAAPGAASPGRRLPDRSRLVQVEIVLVVAAYLVFALRTAANSLGCDFSAYYTAANHWLSGQPIYDLGVAATGTCGTYQYPPPFVLLAVPFSQMSFPAAAWLWAAFLIGCWALGTAMLPVRPLTRWLVLLLAAIGWPLVTSVRIGQVGPILFLVFAIGWRNLSRPSILGASVAIGTLVKLQPGLLGLWLLVRRDWRALGTAIGVGLAVVVVAALVGLTDWIGMATLLRALSAAVTSSQNVAIGASLYRAGVDASVAGVVQVLNAIALVLLVAVASLRLRPAPGFLVAVVASQVISPIVWTHYALLLLLPVAWLIDRRQWWALAIPVAQVWQLQPFVPLWVWTLEFYVVLVGVLVAGWRTRDETVDDAAAEPAAARVPAAVAAPRAHEPAR